MGELVGNLDLDLARGMAGLGSARGNHGLSSAARGKAVASACAAALAALVLSALVMPGAASAVTSPAPPPPPPNDEVSSAQTVGSLPATLSGTTVGAGVAGGESESSCHVATRSSVWYSLRAGASPERVAVELKAAGALDATVDVYHAVRSQLVPVSCEQTGEEGAASLTFKTSKNGLYEIRVAALGDSQLAGFTLSVFLPTPAVSPPGAPLPATGAGGHVDRIQNVNAAYSVTLHSGTSYIFNLRTTTRHGACVSGALFAPGTRSFEEGSSLLRIDCGGYRLFTPGPGAGGRYSFELTPSGSHVGVQHFRVQVGRAGPDETAPGIALGNYGVARAHLNGAGIQVLRLYRVDVHSHSNLTLKLRAAESAAFNVRLIDQNGTQIACGCGASGSQRVQQQLRPGRYYVAVSARGASAGSFALERESRTITHTRIYFANAHAHAGRASAPAGRGTPIHIHVSPAASGPVTVEIERFDPVFGWQFYREVHARVGGGAASIPFAAPAVGQWRVKVAYGGSRVSSPSRARFVYLLST
jgi:hypothetical protein